MSLVTERRCDGCGQIRALHDVDWWALTPPGWDGEDRRLDFCDEACLARWVRQERSK